MVFDKLLIECGVGGFLVVRLVFLGLRGARQTGPPEKKSRQVVDEGCVSTPTLSLF